MLQVYLAADSVGSFPAAVIPTLVSDLLLLSALILGCPPALDTDLLEEFTTEEVIILVLLSQAPPLCNFIFLV